MFFIICGLVNEYFDLTVAEEEDAKEKYNNLCYGDMLVVAVCFTSVFFVMKKNSRACAAHTSRRRRHLKALRIQRQHGDACR